MRGLVRLDKFLRLQPAVTLKDKTHAESIYSRIENKEVVHLKVVCLEVVHLRSSDCHIVPVASRKEASRQSVKRVWMGTSKTVSSGCTS
jgi:hypothetical protein